MHGIQRIFSMLNKSVIDARKFKVSAYNCNIVLMSVWVEPRLSVSSNSINTLSGSNIGAFQQLTESKQLLNKISKPQATFHWLTSSKTRGNYQDKCTFLALNAQLKTWLYAKVHEISSAWMRNWKTNPSFRLIAKQNRLPKCVFVPSVSLLCKLD